MSDVRPMLDRYWRSERCGRSPWRPKLDRLAYVSPESAAPHPEMSISAVNPPVSSLENERRLATRQSSQVSR